MTDTPADREARLLDDEQVREFIANGFLRLTPDVEPSLHVEIDALVRYACEKESWYGNNIASRIPKLHQILRSPVVHGALVSLAGPDYYVHPHRAVHINTPVEEPEQGLTPEVDGPKMGKGSIAGSGWHQDAQSPLARARHHLPRYLIGFYFPHETPLGMGPTRVQAGSHLYAHPVAPHGVVLPELVEAGTFLLLHFDMVHAGFPNNADRTRYMVKFVFARTRNPDRPSWRNVESDWKRPEGCIPDFDAAPAWSYVWNWMRGAPAAEPNGADTDDCLRRLNDRDQPARLSSTYALAGLAEVERLAGALRDCAGQGRHERHLARDEHGHAIPRDDVRASPRRWNERAIVMEDAAYGLAACGETALPALEALLAHDDPWIQINAVFAIGEIGAASRPLLPAIVRLLDSPLQQVVRQALDALGCIGEGIGPALGKIERLLTQTNLEWLEHQVMRGWTGEDQVRLNAAFALLNAINDGEDLPEIERLLTASLGDKNGYVSAVATEGLTRIGTATSTRAALEFLADRRWDDTLLGRAKAF